MRVTFLGCKTDRKLEEDLHFKEMILAAVLRISYRDHEQEQKTVRKLYSKQKPWTFSSPIFFSWLFFWLSKWCCGNHLISLGIDFQIYKKRKLVQRDFFWANLFLEGKQSWKLFFVFFCLFVFPSSSASIWTMNLQVFIKSNFLQYTIKC